MSSSSLGSLLRHKGIDLAEIDTTGPAIDFPEILVHIDLKGLPPKVNYLRWLMGAAADWGATGVIIEWEDMLPYSGDFEILRSVNAYSREDLSAILSAADDAGLEVIPLVPTLGNLEFLLKHRKFSYLREVANDVRVISASHPRAALTLVELLTQVLSLHPRVRRVHFGGHAIPFSLKPGCAMCDQSPAGVILSHLASLFVYLREKASSVSVLIWDDLARGWDLSQLEQLNELR